MSFHVQHQSMSGPFVPARQYLFRTAYHLREARLLQSAFLTSCEFVESTSGNELLQARGSGDVSAPHGLNAPHVGARTDVNALAWSRTCFT